MQQSPFTVPICSAQTINKALIVTEAFMLDEFEAEAFIKAMNTSIAG